MFYSIDIPGPLNIRLTAIDKSNKSSSYPPTNRFGPGPNNPDPSSFSLKDGGVQFVLFGGGTSFKIVESPVAGFNPPLFTFPPRQGDCRALPGEFQAFGTISPGLNAICIITNIKSP